jgi:hypothetical protein
MDDLRKDVESLAVALLELHKELLEIVRGEVELRRGSPIPAGLFLQALLEDPSLQWLRPLSALIVELETLSEQKEPIDRADAIRIADEVELHVSPSEKSHSALAQRYEELLQRSPEVVVAHGRVRAALARLRV